MVRIYVGYIGFNHMVGYGRLGVEVSFTSQVKRPCFFFVINDINS